MKLIDMGEFTDKEVAVEGEKLAQKLIDTDNQMPRAELKKEIDEYINSENTCALSTGNGDSIRCTPIEYLYYNDYFYFITEGGFKFKGIIENSNVGISIFNKYSGFNNLKGLQMQGKAEIIPMNCREYKEIMNLKGIKEEFLNSAPINMNLLRVKIYRYEYLNSNFKKNNFNIKQIYI